MLKYFLLQESNPLNFVFISCVISKYLIKFNYYFCDSHGRAFAERIYTEKEKNFRYCSHRILQSHTSFIILPKIVFVNDCNSSIVANFRVPIITMIAYYFCIFYIEWLKKLATFFFRRIEMSRSA